MVDPVTLSLGVTAAAGATGAIGSIFAGGAQSAMYQYQAQIAQMNANIATQNAAFENALGESQAVQEGMKIRAQVSQTRAVQGASGLDVNSGSAASVRSSEIQLGQIDQSLIRFNASRRAYGDEIASIQDTAQSQLDRMGASTAQTAGTIGAFSSILGTASNAFSQQQRGALAGLNLGGGSFMLGG